MQGTFHWMRVQLFCYATENEELLGETMTELLGTDEFDIEITEGEQGNRIIVMQMELKKQRQFDNIFSTLGEKVINALIKDIENRVDEDCVFYTRLDKQKAVRGEWKPAHHGDVISITGKVVSHPARKEIAIRNLTEYLGTRVPLLPPEEEVSE